MWLFNSRLKSSLDNYSHLQQVSEVECFGTPKCGSEWLNGSPEGLSHMKALKCTKMIILWQKYLLSAILCWFLTCLTFLYFQTCFSLNIDDILINVFFVGFFFSDFLKVVMIASHCTLSVCVLKSKGNWLLGVKEWEAVSTADQWDTERDQMPNHSVYHQL